MGYNQTLANLQPLNAQPAIQRTQKQTNKIAPDIWCERNLYLSSRNTSNSGKLSFETVPYWREPINRLDDPDVRRITIMSGAQVGKSTLLLCALSHSIAHTPGNSLYVMPTENDARRFNKDRIIPFIQDSPIVAKHLSEISSETASMRVAFDNMLLYLGWSNSPSSLASLPCRFVYLDEVDKYPSMAGREADPIKLASARTMTYPNHKIICVSTPTTDHGSINREYSKSDQRHYVVRCPECKKLQPLSFTNITFPADNVPTADNTFYACEYCGISITTYQHKDLISTGIWLPRRIAAADLSSTDYYNYRKNPYPAESDHVGYHMSAIYSPWVTWDQLAREFLESKSNPADLQHFKNSFLGEPWVDRESDNADDSIVHNITSTYQMGDIPLDVNILTCGIDIQMGKAYYSVRGFTDNNVRSYLIEAGQIDYAGSLDSLDEIVTKLYGCGESQVMPISLTCIDSGWQTDLIYKYVESRTPKVRAIKGQSKRTTPYYGSKLNDKNFLLWLLHTNYYKDMLYRSRIAIPTQWFLPLDVPTQYDRHLTSEEKIKVRSKTGDQLVWTPKVGRTENHYLDTEVYALAAYDMLKIPSGFNARKSLAQVVKPNVAPRPNSRWLDKQKW